MVKINIELTMKFKAIAFLILSMGTFGAQGMISKKRMQLIQEKQEQLNRKLFDAVKEGKLDDVKRYIKEGAHIHAQDKLKETPLFWAAYNDYLEIAQLLITHGANVNTRDKEKGTPLHWAAFKGNIEIVQLLIAHGAHTTVQDENNEMPLHDAAKNGHFEIAQLFIAHGVNVNIQGQYGYTPLHHAAENSHYKMAKLLIAHGADINRQNNAGKTPWKIATHLGIRILFIEINAWQNLTGHKAYALVDPRGYILIPFCDETREICFKVFLNKVDIYNLLALFDSIKKLNIQDGFFGTFNNLNQAEYQKEILTRAMQNPNKLLQFLDAGFGMNLTDKEIKTLQDTLQTVQLSKRLEPLYAIACYRVGWDFKKNLQQRSNDMKFADIVIKYDEN